MAEPSLQVKAKIHSLLQETTGLPASVLSDTKPLLDLPNIDSIMMLNFIVRLEDAFGVRFDMDNIDDIFFNVDSLARFLSSKK